MALDMSRTPSKGKKEDQNEIDEAAEHRRERKLELLGLLVIFAMVIYMLSLQASLGNVGIAVYFISITLLGKVGAYVIPLGLVMLAASFLLARKNKAVDGLWKFFFDFKKLQSCDYFLML